MLITDPPHHAQIQYAGQTMAWCSTDNEEAYKRNMQESGVMAIIEYAIKHKCDIVLERHEDVTKELMMIRELVDSI